MGIEQYVLFVSLTLIVMLSPGPGVLHAINNGLRYGVKMSCFAVMGNVLALSILVVVSAIGLGAILVASELYFNILKYLGAMYLFYLGVKLWFSSPEMNTGEMTLQKKNKQTLFRDAFLVTATNPKALAYVTALLPQFMNTGGDFVEQLVLLGFTIAFIQFATLIFYAWFSSKIRPFFESRKVLKGFNRFAGATFVAFGAALAISDRKV